MKPDVPRETSVHRLRRGVALLTCSIFIQTTLFASAPVQAAQPVKSPTSVLQLHLDSLKIPEEIGKVDDFFLGTSNLKVIVVQDAHSIPDAQRSIRKAILYFHQKYGVNLVALEGASAKLDARILKSFPDKERLNKILGQYFDQGELAGGTAAAIAGIKTEDNSASGTRMIFQGVEDWPVYEEALGLYLAATGQEEVVLGELEVGSLKLEDEKKTIYSSELRKIDAAIKAFRGNTSDFMKTLEVLAAVKTPEKGSELELLLEQNKKEFMGRGVKDNSAEVKALAAQIDRYFLTVTSSSETKLLQNEFQGKKQAFQTSQITPEAFALSLKTIASKAGISIRVSDQLLGLVQKEKRMTDIEGTKLFSDFEVYAQSIKELLFKTEQDRELDRRDRRLWLAFKLAKLEVSYEDWVELEQMRSEGSWAVDGLKMNLMEALFQPHFAFYRNAQKRDKIFHTNLQRLLKVNDSRSTLHDSRRTALLVAGGFHAHGLCSLLKESGISYALVMPEIKKMPDESHYREQMRGNFSWKHYFKVEGGKVNLYRAFIRGTRDRLLGAKGLSPLPQETVPSKPQDPRLLKNWRDQIIRDLADEGRLDKAGDYTRFIDEITGDKKNQAIQKRLAQVEQFLDRLKNLDKDGEFTAGNIAKLFQPSMAQTLVVADLDPDAWVSKNLLPASFKAEPLFVEDSRKSTSVKSEVRTAAARSEIRSPVVIQGYAFDIPSEETGNNRFAAERVLAAFLKRGDLPKAFAHADVDASQSIRVHVRTTASGKIIYKFKAVSKQKESRHFQIDVDSKTNRAVLRAYGDLKKNGGVDLDQIKNFLEAMGGERAVFKEYAGVDLPKNGAAVYVTPVAMAKGASKDFQFYDLHIKSVSGKILAHLRISLVNSGVVGRLPKNVRSGQRVFNLNVPKKFKYLNQQRQGGVYLSGGLERPATIKTETVVSSDQDDDVILHAVLPAVSLNQAAVRKKPVFPQSIQTEVMDLIGSKRSLVFSESPDALDAAIESLRGEERYVRLKVRNQADLDRLKRVVKIKDGKALPPEDGRLYDVIRNGGILMIDYQGSDPKLVESFNSLFDPKGYLDKVIANPKLKILGVMGESQFSNFTVAFYSRYYRVQEFEASYENPIEKIKANAPPSDYQGSEVHLYESPEVREALLGKIDLDENGKIRVQNGLLFEAIKKNEPILIRGLDWENSEASDLLSQILLRGEVEFNGEVIPVPADFESKIFTSKEDYAGRVKDNKKIEVFSETDSKEPRWIINPETQDVLFSTPFATEDENHNLAQQEGLLKRYPKLKLLITQSLPDWVWHHILQADGEILIEVMPGVVIPEVYQSLVSSAQRNVTVRKNPKDWEDVKTEKVVLVEADDDVFAVAKIKQGFKGKEVIDRQVTPETTLDELIALMDIKKSEDGLKEFHSRESGLIQAVRRGAVVVLHGLESNPELQKALETLLYGEPYWIQNGKREVLRPEMGQIILVTQKAHIAPGFEDRTARISADQEAVVDLLLGILPAEVLAGLSRGELEERFAEIEQLRKHFENIPRNLVRPGLYQDPPDFNFSKISQLFKYPSLLEGFEKLFISDYLAYPETAAYLRVMARLTFQQDESGRDRDAMDGPKLGRALEKSVEDIPAERNFWQFADALGLDLLNRFNPGADFRKPKSGAILSLVQRGLIQHYDKDEDKKAFYGYGDRFGELQAQESGVIPLIVGPVLPSSETAADRKLRTQKVQQQKQFDIVQALKISRGVMLKGAPGTGKSHLANIVGTLSEAEGGLAYSEDEIIGPLTVGSDTRESDIVGRRELENEQTVYAAEAITKWADLENGGLLIVDEANLTQPEFWNFLEGLFSDNPHIWINGERKPLTDRHRVIFTGNQETLPGRNFLRIVSRHMTTITFDAFEYDFLEEQVENYLDEVIVDNRPELTKMVLDLHQLFEAQDPEGVFSLRDLQELASRINVLVGKTWTAEQVVAQAWQQYGGMFDAKHRQALQILIAKRYGVSIEKIESDAQEKARQKHAASFRAAGLATVTSAMQLTSGIDDALTLRNARVEAWSRGEKILQGKRGEIIEGPSGRGKDEILKHSLLDAGFMEAKDAPADWPRGKVFYHLTASLDYDDMAATIKKAQAEGSVVIISEMNLLPSALLEGKLNDLLTGNAHPGFFLFATMNTADFSAREKLSSALQNRVIYQRLSDYDEEELLNIATEIATQTDAQQFVPQSDLEYVVKAHLWIRDQIRDPSKRPTTRELVKTINLLLRTDPERLPTNMKIIASNKLPADEVVRLIYGPIFLKRVLKGADLPTETVVRGYQEQNPVDPLEMMSAVAESIVPRALGAVIVEPDASTPGNNGGYWMTGSGLGPNKIAIRTGGLKGGQWLETLFHESSHGRFTRRFPGLGPRSEEDPFNPLYQDLEDERHMNALKKHFAPFSNFNAASLNDERLAQIIVDQDSEALTAWLSESKAPSLRDVFQMTLRVYLMGAVEAGAIQSFAQSFEEETGASDFFGANPLALAAKHLETALKIKNAVPENLEEEEIKFQQFQALVLMESMRADFLSLPAALLKKTQVAEEPTDEDQLTEAREAVADIAGRKLTAEGIQPEVEKPVRPVKKELSPEEKEAKKEALKKRLEQAKTGEKEEVLEVLQLMISDLKSEGMTQARFDEIKDQLNNPKHPAFIRLKLTHLKDDALNKDLAEVEALLQQVEEKAMASQAMLEELRAFGLAGMMGASAESQGSAETIGPRYGGAVSGAAQSSIHGTASRHKPISLKPQTPTPSTRQKDARTSYQNTARKNNMEAVTQTYQGELDDLIADFFSEKFSVGRVYTPRGSSIDVPLLLSTNNYDGSLYRSGGNAEKAKKEIVLTGEFAKIDNPIMIEFYHFLFAQGFHVTLYHGENAFESESFIVEPTAVYTEGIDTIEELAEILSTDRALANEVITKDLQSRKRQGDYTVMDMKELQKRIEHIYLEGAFRQAGQEEPRAAVETVGANQTTIAHSDKGMLQIRHETQGQSILSFRVGGPRMELMFVDFLGVKFSDDNVRTAFGIESPSRGNTKSIQKIEIVQGVEPDTFYLRVTFDSGEEHRVGLFIDTDAAVGRQINSVALTDQDFPLASNLFLTIEKEGENITVQQSEQTPGKTRLTPVLPPKVDSLEADPAFWSRTNTDGITLQGEAAVHESELTGAQSLRPDGLPVFELPDSPTPDLESEIFWLKALLSNNGLSVSGVIESGESLELTIPSWLLTEENAKQLARLTTLEGVFVDFSKSQNPQTEINYLSQLKQIGHLNIEKLDKPVSLDPLSRLENLRTINLVGKGISDIRFVEKLSNLKLLMIMNTNVSQKAVEIVQHRHRQKFELKIYHDTNPLEYDSELGFYELFIRDFEEGGHHRLNSDADRAFEGYEGRIIGYDYSGQVIEANRTNLPEIKNPETITALSFHSASGVMAIDFNRFPKLHVLNLFNTWVPDVRIFQLFKPDTTDSTIRAMDRRLLRVIASDGRILTIEDAEAAQFGEAISGTLEEERLQLRQFLQENQLPHSALIESGETFLLTLPIGFEKKGAFQALKDISRLVSLRLVGEAGSFDALSAKALADLTQVKSLWIEITGKLDISSLRGLKNLRNFFASGRDVTGLEVIADMENLEDLSLSGAAITEGDVSRFSALPNLSGIGVRRGPVFAPNQVIADFVINNKDKNSHFHIFDAKIHFSKFDGGDDEPEYSKEVLNSQEELTTAEQMQLLGDIARATGASMGRRSSRGGLELDFSNLDLTDEDLQRIGQLKDITKLNLSHNPKLTDLSPLSKLTNLEEISLSGDRGVSDLSPLHKLGQLRKINSLSGINLSDAGQEEAMDKIYEVNPNRHHLRIETQDMNLRRAYDEQLSVDLAAELTVLRVGKLGQKAEEAQKNMKNDHSLKGALVALNLRNIEDLDAKTLKSFLDKHNTLAYLDLQGTTFQGVDMTDSMAVAAFLDEVIPHSIARQNIRIVLPKSDGRLGASAEELLIELRLKAFSQTSRAPSQEKLNLLESMLKGLVDPEGALRKVRARFEKEGNVLSFDQLLSRLPGGQKWLGLIKRTTPIGLSEEAAGARSEVRTSSGQGGEEAKGYDRREFLRQAAARTAAVYTGLSSPEAIRAAADVLLSDFSGWAEQIALAGLEGRGKKLDVSGLERFLSAFSRQAQRWFEDNDTDYGAVRTLDQSVDFVREGIETERSVIAQMRMATDADLAQLRIPTWRSFLPVLEKRFSQSGLSDAERQAFLKLAADDKRAFFRGALQQRQVEFSKLDIQGSTALEKMKALKTLSMDLLAKSQELTSLLARLHQMELRAEQRQTEIQKNFREEVQTVKTEVEETRVELGAIETEGEKISEEERELARLIDHLVAMHAKRTRELERLYELELSRGPEVLADLDGDIDKTLTQIQTIIARMTVEEPSETEGGRRSEVRLLALQEQLRSVEGTPKKLEALSVVSAAFKFNRGDSIRDLAGALREISQLMNERDTLQGSRGIGIRQSVLTIMNDFGEKELDSIDPGGLEVLANDMEKIAPQVEEWIRLSDYDFTSLEVKEISEGRLPLRVIADLNAIGRVLPSYPKTLLFVVSRMVLSEKYAVRSEVRTELDARMKQNLEVSLVEILVNAAQAAGGRLEVDSQGIPKVQIELGFDEVGDMVITSRDNGRGFNPVQLNQVAQYFLHHYGGAKEGESAQWWNAVTRLASREPLTDDLLTAFFLQRPPEVFFSSKKPDETYTVETTDQPGDYREFVDENGFFPVYYAAASLGQQFTSGRSQGFLNDFIVRDLNGKVTFSNDPGKEFLMRIVLPEMSPQGIHLGQSRDSIAEVIQAAMDQARKNTIVVALSEKYQKDIVFEFKKTFPTAKSEIRNLPLQEASQRLVQDLLVVPELQNIAVTGKSGQSYMIRQGPQGVFDILKDEVEPTEAERFLNGFVLRTPEEEFFRTNGDLLPKDPVVEYGVTLAEENQGEGLNSGFLKALQNAVDGQNVSIMLRLNHLPALMALAEALRQNTGEQIGPTIPPSLLQYQNSPLLGRSKPAEYFERYSVPDVERKAIEMLMGLRNELKASLAAYFEQHGFTDTTDSVLRGIPLIGGLTSAFGTGRLRAAVTASFQGDRESREVTVFFTPENHSETGNQKDGKTHREVLPERTEQNASTKAEVKTVKEVTQELSGAVFSLSGWSRFLSLMIGISWILPTVGSTFAMFFVLIPIHEYAHYWAAAHFFKAPNEEENEANRPRFLPVARWVYGLIPHPAVVYESDLYTPSQKAWITAAGPLSEVFLGLAGVGLAFLFISIPLISQPLMAFSIFISVLVPLRTVLETILDPRSDGAQLWRLLKERARRGKAKSEVRNLDAVSRDFKELLARVYQDAELEGDQAVLTSGEGEDFEKIAWAKYGAMIRVYLLASEQAGVLLNEASHLFQKQPTAEGRKKIKDIDHLFDEFLRRLQVLEDSRPQSKYLTTLTGALRINLRDGLLDMSKMQQIYLGMLRLQLFEETDVLQVAENKLKDMNEILSYKKTFIQNTKEHLNDSEASGKLGSWDKSAGDLFPSLDDQIQTMEEVLGRAQGLVDNLKHSAQNADKAWGLIRTWLESAHTVYQAPDYPRALGDGLVRLKAGLDGEGLPLDQSAARFQAMLSFYTGANVGNEAAKDLIRNLPSFSARSEVRGEKTLGSFEESVRLQVAVNKGALKVKEGSGESQPYSGDEFRFAIFLMDKVEASLEQMIDDPRAAAALNKMRNIRNDQYRLPFWNGDRFNRVMIELVQNALDSIRKTDKATGTVVLSAGFEADQFVIFVKDSGLGVDPEIQQKIFKPGFSTKSEYAKATGTVGKGTGYSREFVTQLLGGTVSDVVNNKTKSGEKAPGATVKVSFPLTNTETQRSEVRTLNEMVVTATQADVEAALAEPGKNLGEYVLSGQLPQTMIKEIALEVEKVRREKRISVEKIAEIIRDKVRDYVDEYRAGTVFLNQQGEVDELIERLASVLGNVFKNRNEGGVTIGVSVSPQEGADRIAAIVRALGRLADAGALEQVIFAGNREERNAAVQEIKRQDLTDVRVTAVPELTHGLEAFLTSQVVLPTAHGAQALGRTSSAVLSLGLGSDLKIVLSPGDLAMLQIAQTFVQLTVAVLLAVEVADPSQLVTPDILKASLLEKMLGAETLKLQTVQGLIQIDADGRLNVSQQGVLGLLQVITSEIKARAEVRQAA